MSESKLERSGSPRGLLRLLLRMPIGLYRLGLGFVLGHRFLMLEHRGRITGEVRRTVLEVVARRPNTYYVVSGWGERSQWLRNVRANPHVRVHVAASRFDAAARVADTDTARVVLESYASRHPRAFRNLVRLMVRDEGATATPERASRVLPVVELSKA